MLEALSGRTHEVYTAVALLREGSVEQVCTCTSVTFTALSSATIGEYLATDEPWDKAGAYGIQGYAGAFVQQIVGSYSSVVGLPLCETRHLLQRNGVTMRHG
jgi:septum formation protein